MKHLHVQWILDHSKVRGKKAADTQAKKAVQNNDNMTKSSRRDVTIQAAGIHALIGTTDKKDLLYRWQQHNVLTSLDCRLPGGFSRAIVCLWNQPRMMRVALRRASQSGHPG